MNPSSSSSKCRVCSNDSNGKRHYGAVVCRACAAFFRRAQSSRLKKTCKKNKQCEFLKDGFFTCKYCRLQKCLNVGMSTESFQFDRDGYQQLCRIQDEIPSSVDTFSGRSNLIIFQAPGTPTSSKPFINIQFLMDKVFKILKEGPETPLFFPVKLEKMAHNLRKVHEETRSPEEQKLEKFGKTESLEHLGMCILTVAKWFTYFDEFQGLPQKLKITILQDVWGIWWKLERLAYTAKLIKQRIITAKKDDLLFRYESERIDLSWCSKYTVEELKFFVEIPNEIRLDELTRLMLDLDPSDVELSFMLGQLCFHYVGKLFQGEILQVADKFQEILADDLHDYYINQLKRPCYSQRLASMMKINNQIQKEVYERQPRRELALIFDVFNVDVSHPEMFAGCL
uniref:Nuclear receptor domain-containing protein n=1 Tax=Caenorhabditis tropicalis TaxID=1561998 RepID=A0A1I7T6N4_9PELO